MLPNLSNKEHLVLSLLENRGEKYGLELVRESKEELKRGTIYVTLGRMEKKGFISSRQEKAPNDPGLPRRLYSITDFGSKTLSAYEMARVHMEGHLAT